MLRPRIIPCLLIRNKGLVKTVKFKDEKYVGDPINAVKIFNEKEVDELIVLDIDATAKNQEPDYQMIKNLSAECRMPLCYGGGIKTIEQAKKILSLGVEKVAFSSAALENPNLLKELSEQVGSQSVVVVLDVKKAFLSRRYEIFTHNGKKKSDLNLLESLKKFQELGIGEIVINSIDHDGVMTGYDWNLIEQVYPEVRIPLTILGGVGSLEDIKKLIQNYKIIGAAAGSFFVFKGKYRAVLISYFNQVEKQSLMNKTD